jgi:capsular exopolysaccharide synthesis family protein
MESNNQKYNNNYDPSYLQIEKPINWRKYIYIFISNWYWFLITVFIAMSVAYVKNRYSVPEYKTSATLLIEDEEGAGDLLGELRSVRRSRRTTDLANEIAKLNAFSLHRRTIDNLGWNIFWTGHGRVAMERPLYLNPPYYIEIDSTSALWYLDNSYYVNQQDSQKVKFYNKNGIDVLLTLDEWNEINGWKFRIIKSKNVSGYASYSFIIYTPNNLAQSYRSKISLESDEEESTIITVSSHGPVIDRESDYINALCENYISAGLERKRLIAENSLEFIEDQILIIQDSLQKSEKQLLTFRINENAVDLSREGQMAYDKLQKFYDQKTQLKLKRNYYVYLKEYIIKKRDPQAIISPTLVDANDQSLIDQVRSLQQLYEEREQLEFSAALENPGLVQINSRIQTSRNKILDILEGLINSNDLSWEQLNTEEKNIEQQLLQLPVSEQELLNIQRKYEVNKQFYTFLLEKRAEAGIQRASAISNVRVLDKASSFNTTSVGTKKSILYLIALLLGLIGPGGIIYLADSLDSRIKDRTDIENNTNLPILGIVSHETTGVDIPVFSNPASPFAESFRHIRTNLQYILREPDRKVIMITSTISGEGKTFIVLNLAAILAMNNKRVLIAGFDLRRPSFHKILNLSNSAGISTFLAGKNSYEEIIKHTNIEGLDVILAGPIPPNPAELIETKRTEELISAASKNYDYIVLDTPPVALVTDAILLSRYTHSNIFIIRQNYSHKGVLEMINNLKDVKMKEISILVNDIRESKVLGYRYYYGYGYEYGYSYSYYSRYGYEYYHDQNEKSV